MIRLAKRAAEAQRSVNSGLPQKSEISLRSAKGAEYNSQGQARSAWPLVTGNQLETEH